MSEWLSGITITCFAASYLVAFGLEVSRLFVGAAIRPLIRLAFTVAGVFAHSIYLWNLATEEFTAKLVPLSSWYDWCLMGSWVLAAAYFGLALRRPENTFGTIMLPLVLLFILLAVPFNDSAPFSQAEAQSGWRMIHSICLLMGTVAVMLGFASGLMYLLQSWRLKKKLPPRQGFRLPSLEWLQRFNTEILFISTICMGLGLVSGIILNLSKHATDVPWTDPVVWSSGLLFLYLVIALLFESFYKPARQGRKVAYLTLASFAFLGVALSMVLFSETKHATSGLFPTSTLSQLASSVSPSGGSR